MLYYRAALGKKNGVKLIKDKSHNKLSNLRNQHHKTSVELERYKLLVDNVQDYAIFLLDNSGNILSWNKGAQKNKGYVPEEIIGQHFSIFYMQKDIDARKPERELELAMRFGRVEDEDWRVRKDGSRFWANVIITTLYNEQNEHIGFAKVTRDLTERKQHEDNLRRANSLLKRQQRELQNLNVAKDEFVSLASHQLRTPATGTKQLLGLLVEGFAGSMSPEHLEIVTKAYHSNERQLSIVNKLLSVAKLDAGKITMRKELLNLVDLLGSIINGHANAFKRRKQTVSLENSNNNITVLGDREHIRMALENLIDNASKYTKEKGKIQISLSCEKEMAIISINDSGIGISQEDIGKLFVRFGRIYNDMSEVVGGSGLGLYWANRVINMHDGNIAVKSVLHHGSTFTVSLPLEKPCA